MKIIEPEEWIEGVDGAYRKKVLLAPEEISGKIDQVQVNVIPAGKSVGAHHHEHCDEVFYVLRGTLNFTIAGKTFRPRAGQLIFCYRGEVHSLENDTDKDFELITFKINLKQKDFVWD